eukprot:250031_1
MSTADATIRLKAILLAQQPAGTVLGKVVGAMAAAKALGLNSQTVRQWIREQPLIRHKAELAGVKVEDVMVTLPVITESVRSRGSLSPELEKQLKLWTVDKINDAESKGCVDCIEAVKFARTLDPTFMVDHRAEESRDPQLQSAFRTRARGWFNRFLRRHNIKMNRLSHGKGGGNRRQFKYDSSFKLRALDMSREVIEGGRGPKGTRGAEATARELGVTAAAIWKWGRHEATLRNKEQEIRAT